ncbi:YrhK family protein [Epilithonimonas hungarica]|uniref:YrhK family protein n=1 Tax=Epilithonimonas hungarica TaxID=454006 RepID=UPI003520FAA1
MNSDWHFGQRIVSLIIGFWFIVGSICFFRPTNCKDNQIANLLQPNIYQLI